MGMTVAILVLAVGVAESRAADPNLTGQFAVSGTWTFSAVGHRPVPYARPPWGAWPRTR
jgi:hypothetical protein